MFSNLKYVHLTQQLVVSKNEKARIWTSWLSPQKLARLQQQTWHQQGHRTIIFATERFFTYHPHTRTNFRRTLQRHISSFRINTTTRLWTKNSCTILLLQSLFMWRMPKRVWSPHQQKRSNSHITKIFSKQTAVAATRWASWINVHHTSPNVARHISRTWRRNSHQKNRTIMENRHYWIS